jgi:CRISPR-associated protein Cas1
MTRELLNTLYIQTLGAYVRLNGDTLTVNADGKGLLQVPLHHLGAVMLFGGATMTPQAMGRCAAEGRNVVFFDHAGRFLARVVGPICGNVLLRQAQYEAQRDETRVRDIARVRRRKTP